MTVNEIRFDNGENYERYMGHWSQLAGTIFLDWLAPAHASRWLDVGCGNGAFTEVIVERCAPTSVAGIDPSAEQITFARARHRTGMARFDQGDAMALPYPDDSFDVAVMPLVIFFVPDPAKGVAEMARVVCAGGAVAAYAWDMPGGGFPYEIVHDEMRADGLPIPAPPSPTASRLDVLDALWADANLEAVTTRVITVKRTFASFDDFWTTIQLGPSIGPIFTAMREDALERMRERLRLRLPADANGRITCSAHANAVKGRVR